MKASLLIIAPMCAILFSACGSGNVTLAGAPASNAAVTAPSGIAPADGAAAAYCTQSGGQVEERRAVYGSNGSSLLFLAGRQDFCQYTSKKDGSRIHILLSTLYTTKPTLAALAYYLKPPTGSCQGNPASCYCSYLGGSDQFGGTTGAGGGWYLKKAIDQTLEACIFPDMSSIDSWGLAYNANGIIRGINLKKVMRYKYPSSRS
jgi:hypothetical protein